MAAGVRVTCGGDSQAVKLEVEADPFATSAVRLELFEQALAGATKRHQYQTLAALMVAKEQTARHQTPEEAVALSAWVKTVRAEMGRQDPVAGVVAELSDALTGQMRPRWWPLD